MSSRHPMITTMIPTYRRPDRLKKAIQSVLDQTYPHFELWIYDNASQDSTKELVQDWAKKDPRIHYYCHSENIGAAENFQFALSRVQTPYFSFLSDDDFLLPEFYETALKGFEKYPDAAASSGAVLDADDRGQALHVALLAWPDQEYFPSPQGLFQMISSYSNWIGTLFCTEKAKQIDALDMRIKSIDGDYFFRLAAHFPIVYSKKLCAVFVQHPTSYSSLYGLKLLLPGWPLMTEKLTALQHLAKEDQELIENLMNAKLQHYLFVNGIKLLKEKNFERVHDILNALNQYHGSKSKIIAMKTLLNLSRFLPGFYFCFLCLISFRRFLSRLLKKRGMDKYYKNELQQIEVNWHQ